MKYNVPSIH